MDAAGPYGFAETVVCVVLVMGKMLFPALNQAGRNRLCPDMHQPPLFQQIVPHLHLAGVNRIQKVLCPGNQEPHNGTLFFRNRPENPLRLYAPENHRLAGGNQGAEPVHLGPGMVERRNTQKHILTGLSVMVLLRLAGRTKGSVIVQNCFGESGGAGGKVNRRVIRLLQGNRRRAGRTKSHEL